MPKHPNVLVNSPKPRYASQSLKRHNLRHPYVRQSQSHRSRQHHCQKAAQSSICPSPYVKSALIMRGSSRVMTVKRRMLGQERGARGSLPENSHVLCLQIFRSQSVTAPASLHRPMLL